MYIHMYNMDTTKYNKHVKKTFNNSGHGIIKNSDGSKNPIAKFKCERQESKYHGIK